MKYLINIVIVFLSVQVLSQDFEPHNYVKNGSFETFEPGTYSPYLPPAPVIDQLAETIHCWTTTNSSGEPYEHTYVFVFSPDQPDQFYYGTTIDWDTEFRFYVARLLPDGYVNVYKNVDNILSASFDTPWGNNYIALITTPHGESGIATELGGGSVGGTAPDLNSKSAKIESPLKHELAKNKTYMFSIEMAKIDHLNGDDVDNKDPHVTIKLKKSSGIGSIKLFDDKISNLSWQQFTKTIDNIHSEGYDMIKIKQNRKISHNAGVYIDRIVLYDPCETEENTCDIPELFEPFLDLSFTKLDTLISISPTETVEFKTIRVNGLWGANLTQIRISKGGALVRNEELSYPPPSWTWDGLDNDGNPVEDGTYNIKVALWNNCFSNIDFFKSFKKKGEYKLFNPDFFSVDVDDPGPVAEHGGWIGIKGLENVSEMKMTVYNDLEEEVFHHTLINPLDIIHWDCKNDLGSYVSDGIYTFKIVLSNNCGTETYSEDLYVNTDYLPSVEATDLFDTDPTFLWEPIEKPFVECPWAAFTFKEYYRPPRDCCAGDVTISDVNLWNDLQFNVLGLLTIGPNVVVEPGSHVIINAGGGFNTDLADAEFIMQLGSDVTIIPSVDCPDDPCMAPLASDTGTIDDAAFNTSVPDIEQEDEIKEISIFPNPTSGKTTVSLPDENNFSEYLIVDLQGHLIEQNLIKSKRFDLELTNFSSGSYLIRFIGRGDQSDKVKLVVKE